MKFKVNDYILIIHKYKIYKQPGIELITSMNDMFYYTNKSAYFINSDSSNYNITKANKLTIILFGGT